MGKDVNLSSREWCDLVFEGKNKDFGAYDLRMNSTKRHDKAVLYTIIGAIIAVIAAMSIAKLNEYLTERALAQQNDQEEVIFGEDLEVIFGKRPWGSKEELPKAEPVAQVAEAEQETETNA